LKQTTRYAEKEDLPAVYVMYLEALKEIDEPHDEKDALDFMLYCWAKAPCILLMDNANIAGFAGLNTYAPSYDKKRQELHEYMFFIKPSHRGIKAWRILCKAVQDVSDKFNLTFVGTHRLTGTIKHHERLIRMAGAKPLAVLSVYEGKE